VTPDNVIERRYGVHGGALTTSTKPISVGKNIGRSNETTPFEQACKEAQALFKKQIESGYSEFPENVGSNGPALPMLAHNYEKHSHKITFPAFVQPKLDGVRMLCGLVDGTVQTLSRTGKPFGSKALNGIVQELQTLLVPGVWLDGELYSDSLTFEEIVSACRKEDSNLNIEYHVYDMFSNQKESFLKRFDNLCLLKFCQIKRVPTFTVDSHEQVCEFHDRFVKEGYEGIMIRNRNSLYNHKRSYDLQKFKNFQDEEFVIVDIKEATGNDAGTAIIQCKTEQGDTFWVRPRGTREYRAEMLKQKDLLIYRLLTVRFQNMTDKGIPRFPVGIIVRDYE
jgi:DNA ligase-1